MCPPATLTVDLLVLVGTVFNGADVQTGLVREEQASRFLQEVGGAGVGQERHMAMGRVHTKDKNPSKGQFALYVPLTVDQ